MARANTISIALATATLLSACGPLPHPSRWTHAPRTIVTTPGIVIDAEDGSFRLAPDDAAPTPFLAYDCPALPTTGNADLGLRLGGRRVRVHHPGGGEPLYGVLSICPLHPQASALVHRIYDVRVEAVRIEETTGGRVSVAFEPHGPPKVYQDGAHSVPAWVLWLSRTPF